MTVAGQESGRESRDVRQPDEPLGWFARPVDGSDAATELRFELSSRGDRVSGRLLAPSAAGPSGGVPLLLVANTASGCDRSLDALARALPARGIACAQVDLPLHGARAEQKLAACVDEGFDGRGPMATLTEEFMVQALADLARSLDALEALEGLDARRVAVAGVELGAEVSAQYCAREARACAAILALGGRPSQAEALQAAHWVGAIAPRPLLLIDAREGGRVPSAAAERLHEAAGEPRTRHAIEDTEALAEPPTVGLMTDFLEQAFASPDAIGSTPDL